jgi:hypothetical protein
VAGIDLSSALGVCASIEQVLQQILQRHAIGPTPLQYPLNRACPQADPEGDVVLDQIAQEPMERAEFVNLSTEVNNRL